MSENDDRNPVDAAFEGWKKGYQGGKSVVEIIKEVSKIFWNLYTHLAQLQAAQVYVFIHQEIGLKFNNLIILILGVLYLMSLAAVGVPLARVLPGFNPAEASQAVINVTATLLGILFCLASLFQMGWSQQRKEAGHPVHSMAMGYSVFGGLHRLDPVLVSLWIEPPVCYVLGIVLSYFNPLLGAWLSLASFGMCVNTARSYLDREKKLDGQDDAQLYGEMMQQAKKQRQAKTKKAQGPAVTQAARPSPPPTARRHPLRVAAPPRRAQNIQPGQGRTGNNTLPPRRPRRT